ncbi:inorganic phosphate transporter Pho88 [Pilobolus umbonatus]|nr:inorganic phosphate transporter Pho88 [Pilobolus umbonatus]
MVDYIKHLNSPYFSIGSFIFFQQLSKVLSLDHHIRTLRIVYLTVQLAIFALNYLLILQIKKKNGKLILDNFKRVINNSQIKYTDQTMLKYVEPAAQSWDGSEQPERLITISVMDYDIAEVNKTIKQSAFGILFVAFIHFKMGYVQPLLVQSILGLKTFFTTKEARIHFWKSPTTGDLRRPFRIEAPFGLVNEKKQPRTDKGSIKKAEKAMKAE